MDIPDRFRDLPEIDARGMEKIQNGERVEGVKIGGDGLEALHQALVNGVLVHIFMCLIKGPLDITQCPSVAIDDMDGLSESLKRKLKGRHITEAPYVSAPVYIIDSFIAGGVRGSWVVFPRVSFSGATFREGADFGDATFGDGADFWSATFGDGVVFRNAIFGDGADFGEAIFGEEARFDGATFGEGASFRLANIGAGVNFEEAKFGRGASFEFARFDEMAGFVGAKFGEEARFFSATFGERSSFHSTIFGEGASFTRVNFRAGAKFIGTTFQGSAVFLGRRGREGEEEEFVFGGEVDFRNLILEAPDKVRFQHANLSQARFLNTRLDKVQFIDADWPKRPDGRRYLYDEKDADEEEYELVAQLYRQLKKNYEEERDYPGAGDFHYGEMEMTLKQQWKDGKFLSWLLTRAYKFLSGYGEEPLWAIYILFWIWVLPAVLAHMQPIMSTNPSPGFFGGLLDSLLVSIKAMSLRLPETPKPILGKFVMILQVFLGPIQIALVALALRRKFRR